MRTPQSDRHHPTECLRCTNPPSTLEQTPIPHKYYTLFYKNSQVYILFRGLRLVIQGENFRSCHVAPCMMIGFVTRRFVISRKEWFNISRATEREIISNLAKLLDSEIEEERVRAENAIYNLKKKLEKYDETDKIIAVKSIVKKLEILLRL